MSEASDLAASPMEITLGGRKFWMSPLAVIEDGGLLDNWIRSRMIQSASEAAKLLPAEERHEVLKAAIAQANETEWMSPAGRKLLASRDGLAFFLWVTLRGKHPKLTQEQVAKLAQDNPQDLRAIMEVFDQLNFQGEDEAGEVPPADPPQQQPANLGP